jgi:hypothetical protein
MPPRVLAPLLYVWSSGLIGCLIFLLVGLIPQSPVTVALLAQLGWLALLGSVPTTLVLTAAFRTANQHEAILLISTVAVAVLASAIGWGHTDLLLSGPRWALLPHRDWLRAAADGALALLAAGGWLWLVIGFREEGPLNRAWWIAVTIASVAALTYIVARHRAYDDSMAQAVLPGGVLLAAVILLFAQQTGHQRSAVALALVLASIAVGSRFDADLVATGERETIAHSRAGALLTLYVMPQLASRPVWTGTSPECASPKPMLEPALVPIDPAKRRNVIVISVDALRKDLAGMRVEQGLVMPELSRLEPRGVSFVRATTTYPATLYAVGSAFTGLSPAELYLSPVLPDTIFTRSRSHVDRQFVVLPDVNWFRLPIVAELFTAGVETYFANDDAAATRMLIRQLKAARRDQATVMAWIHYYAPHDPYRAHPAFPFGRGRKNAYFSEVAFFDAQLGALMRYLVQSGWLEDTLVVFFSDHGEALGERSYYGHHVYVDAWMTDVPLILWHDSLPPSTPKVGVSVADIAPTILHFLGLPQPTDAPSKSLFALDLEARDRPSLSEAFPVRGQALFDGFRLPALDDATIRERLRSIRVTNKGYEPKGSIRSGDHRLIHHRSTDAYFATGEKGASVPSELVEELKEELQTWEREQLRRIRCRLRLNAESPASADPQ